MIINIISSSRYRVEKRKIKHCLLKIMTKNQLELSSLNVIFIGKRKMKVIAEKYKNEKEVLPILTFYYKEQNVGEIFICYPQMILLAAERDKTVDYMLEFLLRHGMENLIKQQSEYASH